MVLHRPYLRADPAAYPESSEICFRAAHQLLTAYRLGADAKASVLWVWWTMSFRVSSPPYSISKLTFTGIPRRGSVRLPGYPTAGHRAGKTMCGEPLHCDRLLDLTSFRPTCEAQSTSWKTGWQPGNPLIPFRPISAMASSISRGWRRESPLNSMIQCTPLTFNSAATRQKTSPMGDNSRDPNLLSINWSPNAPPPGSGMTPDQSTPIPNPPLSEIRGFPEMTVTSPSGFLPNQAFSNHSGSSGETARQPSPMMMPASFQTPDGFSFPSDGFGTAETLGLPQFWASVFGIKMDGDAPGQQGPAPGSSTSQGQPF